MSYYTHSLKHQTQYQEQNILALIQNTLLFIPSSSQSMEKDCYSAEGISLFF